MAAIITNKLRIFNAQEFLQSINRSSPVWTTNRAYSAGDSVVNNRNLFVAVSNGTSAATGTGPTPSSLTDGTVTWVHQGLAVYNNLYMSVARHTPWVNDANPPTPQDSIGYGYSVNADTIAMKKINYADMTLAIPRINWTSGRVYTMFEHDSPEEIIPNNYVITDSGNQYNVYKCISNQRYIDDSVGVQAVASTVKPTSTSTTSFETTSDGYVWKYMYSIELSKALKFLTKDYIPVDTVLYEPVDTTSAEYVQWQIQQNAASVDGEIEFIKIEPNEPGGVVTGGAGYHPNINKTGITLSGNTLSITNLPNNSLDYTGYFVVDLGNNEQFEITEWNVTGTTANVTVNGTFTGGADRNIIVAPGVSIAGNGSGFSAYGLVTIDKISEMRITAQGANWSAVDSATIDTVNVPAFGGDGNPNVNACKIKPIISPDFGHGYNAIEELAGYYVMISMRLEYDEQSTRNNSLGNSETKVMFPVSGDEAQFRQIAVVADPLEATTDNPPATEESYRGPQHPDFGTADEEPFDILTGSGKVLYTENRQPVARAIDQIEDIKIVFEF